MYVRTKKGEIFECYESEQMHKPIYYPKKSKTKGYIDYGDVYKKSNNIIDILEVGDILVIKDFVDEACMIFTDIYLIQNEQQLLNIKNDLEKNKNKKLYSIVTKEQFSCMEYKIGE